MKQKALTGWTKVFAFTLRNHALSKGYLAATISIMLAFLLLIPAGMALFEKLSPSTAAQTAVEDGYASEGDTTETENAISPVRKVTFVDTTFGEFDYAALRDFGGPYFASIMYATAPDVASAANEADADELIVAVTGDVNAYRFDVLLPESTALAESDAMSYEQFLSQFTRYILVEKSGVDPTILTEVFTPTNLSVDTVTTEQEQPGDLVAEIVGMALPYLMIMLMYFLVLAYGQSVANSVVTEKTSKLMDLFLVSIRPGAMMVGKLLAIALTGLIQILCWLGGIAGGFALGTILVKAMNPDTTMGLIVFIELLGQAGSLFSPGGVAIAIALLAGGFLLYCSLSAIGGALASKPEDLSTTNMFFTLTLVVSFLIALYGGGSNGGMVSEAAWLNYIPFTSILVTPGRAMLGQASIVEGCIALALVLLAAFLIALAAGKLYALMAFRKGDPIKPFQILQILRGSRGKQEHL